PGHDAGQEHPHVAGQEHEHEALAEEHEHGAGAHTDHEHVVFVEHEHVVYTESEHVLEHVLEHELEAEVAADHSRESHFHRPPLHPHRQGAEGDQHVKGGPGDQPDVAWRTEMLHLLHAANRLQAAGMSKLHRQDRPEPRWPVSVAVILAIVFQRL